jgi:hypothetical protein
MKTFVAQAFVMMTFLFFDGHLAAHAQTETNEVEGKVVRRDAISNEGTANADLIVKLVKSGTFIRLLYAPHGYSFDAPPPKTNEIMPEEMFSTGKNKWKFVIHPPSDPGQRLRCSTYPKRGVRGRDGSLKLTDPYIPVPGNEPVVVPSANLLPCQIILSRTRD